MGIDVHVGQNFSTISGIVFFLTSKWCSQDCIFIKIIWDFFTNFAMEKRSTYFFFFYL